MFIHSWVTTKHMLQKILCNIPAAAVVWSLGSAQLSHSNYHVIKSILFSSYSRNHQFLPLTSPPTPQNVAVTLHCILRNSINHQWHSLPRGSTATARRCYEVPWQLQHFNYIGDFSFSSFFLFFFLFPAMLPHRACSEIIIFSSYHVFQISSRISAISLFLDVLSAVNWVIKI